MKRGAVGLLALLAVTAPSGCSHVVTATPPRAAPYAEPRWEGALPRTPELILVVRPQALRRDGVFGPLVGRAIELARAHTPLVVATGTLDAMEDAEEVIISARESDAGAEDDFVVVVRGVRASVDPASIVDEKGHALWVPGPTPSAASVRELLRAQDGEGKNPPGPATMPEASLFELPGRTWVIATGGARTRARDAFARPTTTIGSDSAGAPNSALALVRMPGPGLVARIRALRSPGLLAPLGAQLATVTVILTAGDDAAIRATLSYIDEKPVALAETTLREAIGAMSRAKPRDYAWLQSATVQASGRCIILTARLPVSRNERSEPPNSLVNAESLPLASPGAADPPSPGEARVRDGVPAGRR